MIIDKTLWRSQIEISGICNLRCISCPHPQRDKLLNNFMDIDLFNKIINDLKHVRKKKNFVISLNQFGEETLHPKYIDFLNIVLNNGIKLLTSSNSTNFDMEVSRKFIEMGKHNLIHKLVLSLYGVEEESYKKQTGVNLFNKSYENICNFVELYDANNSIFDVDLQVVVAKVNSKLMSKEKFSKLFHIKNENKMKIRYRRAFDWLGTVNESKYLFPLYCNKIASEMAIFSNGDVSYCCFNCFHDPVLGNVKNNTLEEIWNGELANQCHSLWFEGHKREVPLCNSCNRIGPYPKKLKS